MVAVDTETNSQDCRDGRGWVCGVSIAYRQHGELISFYLPFRHRWGENFEYKEFAPAIQKIIDNKPTIYHNAKFDLVSLRTIDINTDNADFYDTMLLSHLVDENMKFRGGFSLDILSKNWLGGKGKAYTPGMKEQLKTNGSYVFSELMAPYAATDTALTLELYELLEHRVTYEKLWEVWKVKREFTRLLMKMEGRGVGIDTELAQSELSYGLWRMAKIIEELKGLNPASPKDLHKLLVQQLGLPVQYNRKTGSPTFDKDAMVEYEAMLEVMEGRSTLAQLILEYRGWQKTTSSNYRPYMALLSPDGRLRCNYKQHGTLTGRLSCEMPNLQQIPREGTKRWNGNLKKCFVTLDPDEMLLEADYSQLELRLGTAYAKEESLIQVFREGRDIFQEMAEALEQGRQETKTMSYAIQYGAGVNRISNVLGISRAAAKDRIDTYYAAYPGFKTIQNKIQTIVQRHGKVPFWSGRFRHFEYSTEAYKAFNSLMQGGSADILERVMLRLDKELPEAKMLLTVHDSVVFQIPRKDRDELEHEIRRIMCDVDGATGQTFGVPFAVAFKEMGHAV